jgi:hypothetical protein
MTQITAMALMEGQKISYWDGRVATVIKAATVPPVLPPPSFPDPMHEVDIIFDADEEPQPVYTIKVNDFMRAEPIDTL